MVNNKDNRVFMSRNNRSAKARFIRRISAVSNAIETIDNEMICFIIFCLNCIRHGRNTTYEPGLTLMVSACIACHLFERELALRKMSTLQIENGLLGVVETE